MDNDGKWYLLFAGQDYYPDGPGNFIWSFTSREAAQDHWDWMNDWAEVWEFDPKTGDFKAVSHARAGRFEIGEVKKDWTPV